MTKIIKMSNHLTVILTEMCSRVGAKLEDIDLFKDQWQEDYSWSIEEEIDFQNWLFKYLVTNQDSVLDITDYTANETISTTDLMNLTKEFTLFYGWALDEDDMESLDKLSENKP